MGAPAGVAGKWIDGRYNIGKRFEISSVNCVGAVQEPEPLERGVVREFKIVTAGK